MSSTILNGRNVRDELKKSLFARISQYKEQPTLCIISVGSDERSATYINQKKKFGESIGVRVIERTFGENCSFEDIKQSIEILNTDREIHGIIVQMPLPAHLDAKDLCALISPLKDVDGLHPENIGLLAEGKARFIPATAKGIISLLGFYDIPLSGKHVVIINRSLLVGKPLANLFLAHNATVTVAHSKTENLSVHTKSADIVVVAVGKPGFLMSGMIKPGAVIIDVGISRIDADGEARIVGDVDFEEVEPVASAITPVPGGVGPMTVLSLFENVADAYELAEEV